MRGIRRFDLALAGLLVVGASCARADDAPPASGQASAANEAIDEITVVRKRMGALKKEMELAQEQLYDAFNARNSDDELDIHCSFEVPINSHISRRVCRPNFVGTATSRAARELLGYIESTCPDLVNDPGCLATAVEVGSGVARSEYRDVLAMARRLDAEMQRLVREDPAIAKARSDYEAKRQAYRQATERRRK